MKNILLLAHDDEGQEARLQAALDVTRALNGHLTCLDVFVPPAIYADVYTGGGTAVLVEQDIQQQAAQNRTTVEARLMREDISWNWQEVRGNFAPELARAAELADLIVLNSHFEGFAVTDPRRITADVVMKSDRPVLAVPDTSRGIAIAGPAMIAWDGSSPAAEALKAAVPLLRLASAVTFFELGEPDAEYPASEAAIYLSRHDIHAKIFGGNDEGDVAGQILERARKAGISYIVMGAFGHSRTMETLFGGVTRSLLTESDVPLFLAH